MKTLAGWHLSGQELTPYLQPGDEVEDDFADWALDIMPPAFWRPGAVIQIGEAQSHVDGRPTFATFHREYKIWRFIGFCHRGKLVAPDAAPGS